MRCAIFWPRAFYSRASDRGLPAYIRWLQICAEQLVNVHRAQIECVAEALIERDSLPWQWKRSKLSFAHPGTNGSQQQPIVMR